MGVDAGPGSSISGRKPGTIEADQFFRLWHTLCGYRSWSVLEEITTKAAAIAIVVEGRQQPPDQGIQAKDMHPIAPRRRPFRPHFPYTKMLLSTRSRYSRLSHKRHFLGPSPYLTPKSASPATSSKNFRLRRSKVPLRGTAGCLPAPALGSLCDQPQCSKHASPALPARPKVSKACGAPEEEEKKVFITAKTTRRLLRSTAGFAFLDRAGERPTDLLSHSRADKRLAEIGTKRSTAEHKEKHSKARRHLGR